MYRRLMFASAVLATLSAGCSDDNSAPVLDLIGDQRAFVNSELALTITASDPDGDPLSFSFAGELDGIDSRASLGDATNARAVFRWTPLATDVGTHPFDFTVSDGQSSASATITIDVTSSGEGTAPMFVQPLGTGSTLDLQKSSCLAVPIVVEDPDSPGVTLGQEEPLIVGAEVNQQSELGGEWSFCPSREQIDADDRYALTLSADDGDNPKTLKPYLIVLRSANKTDCPGDAPVVTHTPKDLSTVNDISIVAEVSDDQGIKYEPLLYYSDGDPGNPPDVTRMTQLTMTLQNGDMVNGTWAADIPNPVASQSQGATEDIYYVIVAQDNDDAEGSCDHLTQAPATGSFELTVENPGGSGGLALCDACTADAQCGGSGDLCVFMGGGHHCFTSCTQDTDCQSGYYCSISMMMSIDNASGRQCIPTNYMCGGNGNGCVDDSFEENDSRTVASGNAALTPGNHASLKSCPDGSGDDEDWYKIDVSSDAQVGLSITGGSATDLDLALYDSNGTLLDKSDSFTSSESLSQCLLPGVYYARVYAYGSGENSYSLSYTHTAANCGPTCQDDSNEDDDSSSQARLVNLNNSPYVSTTNAICSMDDDWYDVLLFNGETVYVTLTFSQTSSSEDLDIYFYQNGINLTGCDEQTPLGCDPLNGQSGSSNESLSWPITQTGTYYVVVHGWNGSENLYDICIGLTPTECP